MIRKIAGFVLLSGAVAFAQKTNPGTSGSSGPEIAEIFSQLAGQEPVAPAEVVAGETNLPLITVTASRNELIYLNKAETVQVIDRKEIETVNSSKTGDILKYSPGASVTGGTGAAIPDKTVVSLNGLSPAYTLVLVDGVRLLSDHSHTGQNLELIPPECIERIEVLRGAASAQYGRDAIGGVVNIVTRKWTGKPYASVGASVGSFETYENNINVMLPLGENVQLSSSTSWEKSDGRPIATDTNRFPNAAIGRAGYQGYERVSMFNRLDARLSDQTTAFGVLNGVWNNMQWKPAADDHDQESTLISTAGGLTHEITPSTEWFSQVSYSEWSAEANSELDRKFQPETHFTQLIGDEHVLMVGADFLHNTFERKAVTNNVPNQQGYGTFVQDEWTPSEMFTLMGALRYDKVEGIDEAVSPKLSALITPADWVALRASVGRGFHAPTLMELYEYRFPHSGTKTYRNGNPDLEPEYSTTYTTGLELKPVDSVQWSVYGFYSEIDDMIVMEYDGMVGSYQNWTRQNIEKATVYGAETAAKWTINDLFALDGGYTWTDNEDESTGRQLPYSPGSTIFTKLTLTEQLSTNFTVRAFFGARYAYDRQAWSWRPKKGSTPGNDDGLTYELADYLNLDAGISVTHKDLTLFAKVENILGEEMEECEDAYVVYEGDPFYRIGLQYNLPFLN